MSDTPDLDKAHPCDEALGNIHALALSLEMSGCTSAALTLATAHERIQQYLIGEESRMLEQRAEEAERVRTVGYMSDVDCIMGQAKRAADLRRQVGGGE